MTQHGQGQKVARHTKRKHHKSPGPVCPTNRPHHLSTTQPSTTCPSIYHPALPSFHPPHCSVRLAAHSFLFIHTWLSPQPIYYPLTTDPPAHFLESIFSPVCPPTYPPILLPLPCIQPLYPSVCPLVNPIDPSTHPPTYPSTPYI